MSLTDYGEEKVMNHVFYGTVFTKPTNWYVGLFTVSPGESTPGTEVTGNGYTRMPVTFGQYTTGHTVNTVAITFPAATPAGWGNVIAFGLFELSSGGTCFAYASLDATVLVSAGNVPEFAVGELDITAD
jgi:hypothetical protein